MRSERRKKIVELRAKGLPTREIAKTLGVSLNNIQATLAHMIKLGYITKFTPEQIAEKYKKSVHARHADPQIIIELRNSLNPQEIARTLNQKLGYVKKVLKGVQKKKAALFKEKVIELYATGTPYKEMMRIFNCSSGRIGVVVNRLVKQGKLTLRRKLTLTPEKLNPL